MPAVTRHMYLNCGTFGPLPTATSDELCGLVRLVEAEGTINSEVLDELWAGYASARRRLAGLVDAAEDEIALTTKVSTGVNIVAFGLDWRPGDEVIVTDVECPSASLACVSAARQQGVVIKLLSIGSDRARIVSG